MRIMARNAGGFAFEKARALAEVNRLMTDVPRIVEVRGHALSGRHAMALSAFFVETHGPVDVVFPGFQRMLRSGTMAGFTTHSGLKGLDGALVVDTQFARRMALEASENSCVRREGLVLDPGYIAMPGRKRETALRVFREAVFKVGILV